MPPVTTLPYGEAPAWCFPAFEISMYILFVLCLVHAAKRSMGDVSYLFGGLLFGLLLEYINVAADMGYVYGGFAGLWATMVNLGGFLRQHGVTDGVRLICTLGIPALIIMANRRKRKTETSSQPVVIWLVPLWFHLFFFAWLFIGGFYKESGWLIAAGILGLLPGAAVHTRRSKREKIISLQYA